jgi:uncharacterized protein
MRIRACICALALVVLCAAALAQSLTFPPLTGRVVDEAGILNTETRAQLEKLSADLEAKSSDQLVVVTLKSLQGRSIEDYGYQLGRHWQIGQKDKNNGVILIVAPNDKRVRIEVGYGLEGSLTDAISSVIIQSAILPRFRTGDFAGGTLRGAQDIVRFLTGDAEEFQRRAEDQRRAADRKRAESQISSGEWVVVAFWLIVLALIIFNVVADMRRGGGPPAAGRRGRGGTSYSPVIIAPSGGWSGGSSSGGWSGGSSGGFSGGGGSFGGGGASGSW